MLVGMNDSCTCPADDSGVTDCIKTGTLQRASHPHLELLLQAQNTAGGHAHKDDTQI